MKNSELHKTQKYKTQQKNAGISDGEGSESSQEALSQKTEEIN